MALLGVGSSFVWAPLTTTANRNLPLHQAGAGAGIYNANRQIGSVLGAAAIAVLIDSRLAANGLGEGGGPSEASLGGTLPEAVHDAFSSAMSQAMFLLPAVLVLGVLAVLFFERPRPLRHRACAGRPGAARRPLRRRTTWAHVNAPCASACQAVQHIPTSGMWVDHRSVTVSWRARSPRSAGSRRPRRCARPCRPRPPCPRHAGRRASCCRPRRRPSARPRSWRACGRRRGA